MNMLDYETVEILMGFNNYFWFLIIILRDFFSWNRYHGFFVKGLCNKTIFHCYYLWFSCFSSCVYVQSIFANVTNSKSNLNIPSSPIVFNFNFNYIQNLNKLKLFFSIQIILFCQVKLILCTQISSVKIRKFETY